MTTVEVRQHHINVGVCGDCLECPVALAIEDAIGLPARIEVSVIGSVVGNVRFTNVLTGRSRTIDLPKTVSDFIVRFDQCRHVEPFNFPLSPRRVKEIL